MAWSTPSAQVTGDLITAAIWNQNVVNNPILLKTSITTAGNLMRPVVTVTTSTGADYSADVTEDIVIVTAGDVTVALASATASSTGRWFDLKNLGSGTVRYKCSGVGIDGTTSTASNTLTSGESLTFFRLRSTDWAII